MSAISAVDMALWGHFGQRPGRARSTGSSAPGAAACHVHANAWFAGSKNAQILPEKAAAALELGFQALKVGPLRQRLSKPRRRAVSPAIECIEEVYEVTRGRAT